MLQKKMDHIKKWIILHKKMDHIAQTMWQLQKNKNGDRP
jgi:hypothetical protein